MADEKIKLISIAGPTASGKTSLSVNLALALDSEIVSADSMQIYKGMDIATAKPDTAERKGIIHHLMDFVEPDDVYSVARYVRDASNAIECITSKNKTPILVGGTGLYIDSLLNGISFCEGEVDFELRKKLQDELESTGIDNMISKLAEFDPIAADKFSIERNPKRIIRAFEVYYTTGVSFTDQNILSKKNGSPYNPTKIALNFRRREKLYARINSRVDVMMSKGLLEEAKRYFSLNLSDTSKQAIGYKELKPFFDGDKTLDDCIENLKQSTRRYAKRQLTWFNRDPDIQWFFVDDYKDHTELYNDIVSYLSNKGFDFS